MPCSPLRRAPFLRPGLVFTCFFLCAAFFLPVRAGAERITYPGTSLKSVHTIGNSLAPSRAVRKNTVKVKKGTISGAVFGAAASGKAHARNNKVTVSGGRVRDGVMGGSAVKGNALSNSLTIKKGTFDCTVYRHGLDVSQTGAFGGRSTYGNASKNKVTISGGKVKSLVAGGYVETAKGKAVNNRVVISKKAVLSKNLYGGFSVGAVQQNMVTITGGKVKGKVYGGRSNASTAKDNSVIAQGGTITNDVCGGESLKGTVSGNRIAVSGSAVLKKVRLEGGYANKGAAKNNAIIFTGGNTTLGCNLRGGASARGNATGNKIEFSGTARVSGMLSSNSGFPISAGYADKGNASGNMIIASGGTVSLTEMSAGESASGNVSNNSVVVTGGTIDVFRIVGGATQKGNATGNSVRLSASVAGRNNWAVGGETSQGDATGNTVTVTGGVFDGVKLWGGNASAGNATGNTVTFSGGYVENGTMYGGVSGRGEASFNTVHINGGVFDGIVAGGHVSSDGDGRAVHNTVIISGSPDIGDAQIYGGEERYSAKDVFTGNRLVINGFTGSIGRINNFQYYDFTLPAGVRDGFTVISTSSYPGDTLGGSSVSIKGFAPGAGPLQKGSVVTLIDHVGDKPKSFDGANVARGVAEIYTFELVDAADTLQVRVSDVQLNAKTSVFTKARTETLDLLTRSADRVAEQTMSAVRLSAKLSATGGGGLFLFGDHSGSLPGLAWSSEGKVSSSLAGLGFSSATAYGTLAFGSFFESGWTDRHTDAGTGFDSAALREREQSSYGSGVLARFDHTSGLYAEGAFRYGKAQNNFSESGLRDGFGNRAAFDAGFAYTGFHTGLGHVYALNDSVSVESYSKLFVTRLDGGSADVLGDKLHFSGSESRRIRSGAKFSFAFDERINAFAGFAHEYEADGKIRADIAGHTLERDGARGHSAMFQAGFSFKPVADAPVSLYVDYRGYAGARKDTNASAGLMVEF